MNNKLFIKQSSPARQAGLSLIELMIASVVGLFILAGAVTIFSGNNQTSSMSTGMARLQDSGRVAIEILSDNIRMAGFEGCDSSAKADPTVVASEAPTIRLPFSAIWGSDYTNAWNPARHADLNGIKTDGTPGSIKPDTDIIYLQHGSGRTAVLANSMNSNAANLDLTSNPDFLTTGDLMMISDCSTADIFRATNVATVGAVTTVSHGGGLNDMGGDLSKAYLTSGAPDTTPLRVMKFNATAYFVGLSGRTTPTGLPIYSLFSQDLSVAAPGNPTELIEGVENIQIVYGEVMPPTDNIRYVSASGVNNMNNVKSVQIGLLIATADYASSLNDKGRYNLAGTTVTPPGGGDINHAGDRRLRTAFNTTIQIRNRSN